MELHGCFTSPPACFPSTSSNTTLVFRTNLAYCGQNVKREKRSAVILVKWVWLVGMASVPCCPPARSEAIVLKILPIILFPYSPAPMLLILQDQPLFPSKFPLFSINICCTVLLLADRWQVVLQFTQYCKVWWYQSTQPRQNWNVRGWMKTEEALLLWAELSAWAFLPIIHEIFFIF